MRLAARTYGGGPTKDHILESSGTGVALLDFDADGRLDIYLVTAAELTPARERIQGLVDRLRPGHGGPAGTHLVEPDEDLGRRPVVLLQPRPEPRRRVEPDRLQPSCVHVGNLRR